METILIVGASGNIGVSNITAALRSGYKVLAIVRNQASADKLYKHVGTKDSITTVEADVTSDNGVQSVVDQVRAGKLPSFQHVYTSVGFLEAKYPLQSWDVKDFRRSMHLNLETNFLAFKATMPYLLEQGNPNSTFTFCTGGAGELGYYGATGIAQGALFSMITTACRENAKTNIRVNEVYLCCRVEYDAEAEGKDTMKTMGYPTIKASDFAKVYEKILKDKQIKGCRVSVFGPEDIDRLSCKPKLTEAGDATVHAVWRNAANTARSMPASGPTL